MSTYNRTLELTIVGVREDNASMAMMLAMEGMDQTIMLEAPMTVFSNAFGFNLGFDDLYILCESPEYSKQVAKDSIRLMENRHDVRGQNAILMQNFNDIMDSINDILGYVTAFIVLVAAISLLVGGIGVMNIMLVSVTERTREIGIRKSLGARTSSILLQFLSESAIITLLGGLIGITLGILGAAGVCALLSFPVKVSLGTVLGATLFSSAVGVFFGIYPARKAAKLSPIEALRHE
jgi:putative ABC transport system permease protein